MAILNGVERGGYQEDLRAHRATYSLAWIVFHRKSEDVEVAHVDYHLTRGTIELSAADDRLGIRLPLEGHAKLIPTGAREASGL
jgi:hypothetical protein